MENISQRLNKIRSKIDRAARKSGRTLQDITLVAVSKTVGPEAVMAAFQLGVTDFGENRVQELIRKSNLLPQARWHLIGRLQSNKVKDVVGKTCLIHSLDRWPLAEEINKRGAMLGIRVPALVQVNITGEKSKTGLEPGDVLEFLQSAGQLPALQIMGLMTMAEEHPDPEASRPVFRELADLRSRMAGIRWENVELRHLSMGMSQDYEVAVEEGADIVRIGSALFN
ncbi:MAG: YggS family pyridoxal phosphate-dependent enzyme [Syntrophomonadaceae bacterium]